MSDSRPPPSVTSDDVASLERKASALRDALIDRGPIGAGEAEAMARRAPDELSPANGARVIARAWVDPAFRQRLLADATAAAKELGIVGPEGHQMVAVENSGKLNPGDAAGARASVFKLIEVRCHRTLESVRGYDRAVLLFKNHAGARLL
jgi:hypothetical protein